MGPRKEEPSRAFVCGTLPPPPPLPKDHLMVVYLANLVKTQLVLGEKLSQIT